MRKAIVKYKYSIIFPLAVGIFFILEGMKHSRVRAGGDGLIHGEPAIWQFVITNSIGFSVGLIAYFSDKSKKGEKYLIRYWAGTFMFLNFLFLFLLAGQ